MPRDRVALGCLAILQRIVGELGNDSLTSSSTSLLDDDASGHRHSPAAPLRQSSNDPLDSYATARCTSATFS